MCLFLLFVGACGAIPDVQEIQFSENPIDGGFIIAGLQRSLLYVNLLQ